MTQSHSGWNYAEIFEAITARQPQASLFEHGDLTLTWEAVDRRANGVAAALLEAGYGEQDKVAQFLYNCPQYVESMMAAFKAGLAVVNTNYRYTVDELTYLWDNADVVAVVFHGAFAERCEEVRQRLARITTWLWVDDGSGPCPPWATPYETAASAGTNATVAGPWGRSGDHLVLLYTGGTTGMPKGVMWRQDDLIGALELTGRRQPPERRDGAVFAERISRPGPRNLAGAPLMHGTGLFNALGVMILGGSVVTVPGRRFDAVELLGAVERHRAKSVTIVGDAFARPLLSALDAEPQRWDLTSLRLVLSSGVLFSPDVKAALIAHLPGLIVIDSYGSSEGLGLAASTATATEAPETARFDAGTQTRVLDEDGHDVVPGSGVRGLVAIRGFVPLGYYKDEAKSATTFRIIGGVRHSLPGDWATVDADGAVRLLGRGSQVINTGGEKVHPEEIEALLAAHDAVADAAVVGVPDERFGESIVAIVELAAGDGTAVDGTTGASTTGDEGHDDLRRRLDAHVRAGLAGYKAPRRYVVVDSLGRAPNGKLDYRALKRIAYVTPDGDDG